MSRTLRLRHHIRAAFTALPLESIAVAVAVVSLWCAVGSADEELTARWFLSAVLAVPLLFAITILRRAARISTGVAAVMGGLAAVAAIAMGASGPDVDDVFAWRFGLAFLAAVMLPFVAAAASVPRGERMLGFADFVRRFSEETTASGLLWGAAMIAVAVLVISVRELFAADINKLGIDAAGAISGVCVLAYLDRLLPGRTPARVPELWRRLIARVAAPFLVAMLALLGIYELWVIARGELPANLVSPLIVAAGALGFACTLVIESLVAVREPRTLSPADPHRWAGVGSVRLSRAFTAVLLALLPLAAWALWVRIDQHGLTPARAARMYALGCLGLLAAWGTVRWIRRRRPLTWEVPVATAITALIAAVGPLSVVHLSIRSQTARLEQALDGAGFASRTVQTAPPEHPVPLAEPVYQEILERVGVLAELGGTGAVGRVLTGDLASCRYRWTAYDCLAHLGIATPVASTSPSNTVYVSGPADQSVAGFHVVEIGLQNPHADPVLGALVLSVEGPRIVVRRDGQVWASAELGDLGRWLEAGTIGAIPPLLDGTGCTRAHAVARGAQVERDPGGPRIRDLDLHLLIPERPDCP